MTITGSNVISQSYNASWTGSGDLFIGGSPSDQFGNQLTGSIMEFRLWNEPLKEEFFDTSITATSITVSFVKISKDLRIASIYIMPLGGIEKEKIIDLINKNKHKFQKALSEEKLKLKYIPKLKFYLDDTFDEADKIEKLLSNEKVLRDLK